ncbi:hypothetical protein RE9431_10000 [Prescottella equi]|nr:hypothetical protein RE9431_10000 [Prescottella equi]BCN72398.1 hypothetical protein RE0327_09970 [Prescottella equi]
MGFERVRESRSAHAAILRSSPHNSFPSIGVGAPNDFPEGEGCVSTDGPDSRGKGCDMALTEASAHAGEDSVPPPGGFLQLFMEANRLAGRAVSGSVPDRGVDIAGDRRPE